MACSASFLVFSVATLVWAIKDTTGRERERYMVQAPIMIAIAIGLTIAAVYELMRK